jgi:hypothetical protein
MPTISSFYGILIRMFYNDHAPPHFHARYGEFEATVEIESLAVRDGETSGASAAPGDRMGSRAQNRADGGLAAVPGECGAGEN